MHGNTIRGLEVSASGRIGSSVSRQLTRARHSATLITDPDVEFIAADQLNSQAEESIDAARARIGTRPPRAAGSSGGYR